MALDNGGSGEACILLFGLNDNIKFASMGYELRLLRSVVAFQAETCVDLSLASILKYLMAILFISIKWYFLRYAYNLLDEMFVRIQGEQSNYSCNIMRKSVDGVAFYHDAMKKVKDLENLCLKQALRLRSVKKCLSGIGLHYLQLMWSFRSLGIVGTRRKHVTPWCGYGNGSFLVQILSREHKKHDYMEVVKNRYKHLLKAQALAEANKQGKLAQTYHGESIEKRKGNGELIVPQEAYQ
ncbi:hypothetical protein E3N88_29364 [Mikania micrantha]|uniref:Uncharacterized protein n=1 Tax=Mikania micrantha TaxID=192012 RepID=A0A5N6MIK6_9ASTR|nr:hypothetical protein E3N88_29364 [Mikania micrantha]